MNETQDCYLPRQICERCWVMHLQKPFRIEEAVKDAVSALRDEIEAELLKSYALEYK